jgi:hypothetical protein
VVVGSIPAVTAKTVSVFIDDIVNDASSIENTKRNRRITAGVLDCHSSVDLFPIEGSTPFDSANLIKKKNKTYEQKNFI